MFLQMQNQKQKSFHGNGQKFCNENTICKKFLKCKTKKIKMFCKCKQSLRIKIKSSDKKTDNPENKKIKRFCKCKLQTGKKFLQKWENSFDKHKNSYLISHLIIKPQT